MPNELPLPPELRHLIEKREQEDRRAAERRLEPEQHASDVAKTPEPDDESTGESALMEDHRGGGDRRETSRRLSE